VKALAVPPSALFAPSSHTSGPFRVPSPHVAPVSVQLLAQWL